ncbi:putative zinc finger protein 840 isoform X2 [Periplaneta americana]|uniref:putative zinc finger protein 840 isoform X2 n=1 Tax=Periplaneta americana TaxID=6978 RepID=UPI0037E94840
MDTGDEICRMCMSDSDIVLHNIFNVTRVEESIVAKIWDCLGLKVYLGDGLPSFICHQCLFKLDVLHEFKKMCYTSNDHLSKQRSTSVVTTVEEDMEVESLTNASPVPYGIGCIVEGSARSLEIEPEFVGNKANVDDESVNSNKEDEDENDDNYEADDSFSRESSRMSLHSSEGSDSESEQKLSSLPKSVVLQRHSSSRTQPRDSKPNTFSERKAESSQLRPVFMRLSDSSQLQNIFRHRGMVMFPSNDSNSPQTALNVESAALSTDETHSSAFLDIRRRKTDVILKGKILSNISNEEYNVQSKNYPNTKTKRKLHMEGKFVKVPSTFISKSSQERESSSHVKGLKRAKTSTRLAIPSDSQKVSENKHKTESHTPVSMHKKYMDEVEKSPFEICVKTETAVTVTNFNPNAIKESEPVVEEISAGVFKCTTCNKIFLKKRYLKQHIVRRHHIPISHAVYTCEVCSERFLSMRKLETHMKTHSLGHQFKCSSCGKTYSHSWLLDRHINIHSDLNKFVCEKCGRKFTSARYLDKHMHCHNKIYVCEICNKAFSLASYLKKHTSKFHSSSQLVENELIEEQQCLGQLESSEEDIVELQEQTEPRMCTASHLNDTSEKESDSGICSDGLAVAFVYRTEPYNTGARENVNKDFENLERENSAGSSKLYKALTGNTEEQPSNYCPSTKDDKIQDRIMKRMNEENNNKETAHTLQENKAKEPHQCNHCRLLFERIDELNDHEHQVHSQNKIYSCFVCLKLFTQQVYVKIHAIENKCVRD